MNSKVWMVIIFIGVGAVGAMGMIARFAINSNPKLQKTIQFKQDLAHAFEARGVREVSVRRLSGHGAYQLTLIAELPQTDEELERLDADVADFFIREYEDRSSRFLKISYAPVRSAWGIRFAHAEPTREKDVELAELRRKQVKAKRQRQLLTDLAALAELRVASLTFEGTEELKLDLQLAVEEDDLTRLLVIAKSAERKSRTQLRGFYSKLLVRVFAPKELSGEDTDSGPGGEERSEDAVEKLPTEAGEMGETELLLSVRFDRRGVRLR